MRRKTLPRSLRGLTLIGFEPKEGEDGAGEGSESDDDDDGEGEGEGSEGNGKEGEGQQDAAALLTALQRERRDRKKMEKELRQLRKVQETAAGKEKTDTEQAKEEASKERSKSEKLADKLQKSAVDNAIIKLATGMKFRDLDDALQLINRGDIDIEQDDDDPAEIEVDEASVKTALETLARKKPHLLVADGSGERSGSSFSGKGKKTPKEAEDAELREKYSALQRTSVQGQS